MASSVAQRIRHPAGREHARTRRLTSPAAPASPSGRCRLTVVGFSGRCRPIVLCLLRIPKSPGIEYEH